MDEELEESQQAEVSDHEKIRPHTRPRTILESFKYAIDGILDVFRTQRHMRFHFITMALVLIVALLYDLSRRDILILLFTISLVLMAEMFNTAIEAVVDMVTQSYHPLAKFAKDAAAGGVLIATVTAIMVGLILSIGDTNLGRFGNISPEDPNCLLKVMLTGLVLLVAVTIIKVIGSRGKLLKGGIVSGHAAAGFFLAATILFISRNGIAAILGIMMALLIAQSRVEAKIHSIQEVITGALLAMLVTAFVYWFPGLWNSLAEYVPILGGVFILGYGS